MSLATTVGILVTPPESSGQVPIWNNTTKRWESDLITPEIILGLAEFIDANADLSEYARLDGADFTDDVSVNGLLAATQLRVTGGPRWHQDSGYWAARNAANNAYTGVLADRFQIPFSSAYTASGIYDQNGEKILDLLGSGNAHLDLGTGTITAYQAMLEAALYVPAITLNGDYRTEWPTGGTLAQTLTNGNDANLLNIIGLKNLTFGAAEEQHREIYAEDSSFQPILGIRFLGDTGIATYYGDGSNLTGVTAAIPDLAAVLAVGNDAQGNAISNLGGMSFAYTGGTVNVVAEDPSQSPVTVMTIETETGIAFFYGNGSGLTGISTPAQSLQQVLSTGNSAAMQDIVDLRSLVFYNEGSPSQIKMNTSLYGEVAGVQFDGETGVASFYGDGSNLTGVIAGAQNLQQVLGEGNSAGSQAINNLSTLMFYNESSPAYILGKNSLYEDVPAVHFDGTTGFATFYGSGANLLDMTLSQIIAYGGDAQGYGITRIGSSSFWIGATISGLNGSETPVTAITFDADNGIATYYGDGSNLTGISGGGGTPTLGEVLAQGNTTDGYSINFGGTTQIQNAGSVGLLGMAGATITVMPNAGSVTDWNLVLPPDGGSEGYVLRTDGAGTTSWVSASSGSPSLSDTLAVGSSAGANPITDIAYLTMSSYGTMYLNSGIIDFFGDGTVIMQSTSSGALNINLSQLTINNSLTGWSGYFQALTGETVTVTNGIITDCSFV